MIRVVPSIPRADGARLMAQLLAGVGWGDAHDPMARDPHRAVALGRMTERAGWPALSYAAWGPTCDTLHAHTQILGKLAVELAPPEPQLQHAALRLTPRGWETRVLPAPDGSGAIVAGLDLRTHEALVEHSDGRQARIALTPNRPVAQVTREVLAAVRRLGGEIEIDPKPQEVPWKVPLDEDREHSSYEPQQVETYFAAATRAALVLDELRAPYRGRVTPVNAWWGTFDIAIAFYSGESADPPGDDFIMRNSGDAEMIEIGWWPGDPNYDRAAFFAFAHPAPDGFADAELSPEAARWDPDLGEFVLDWEDLRSAEDPHRLALEFARSAFGHACAVCGWDPGLAGSAAGSPPPIR
jgi:hypothetical protein